VNAFLLLAIVALCFALACCVSNRRAGGNE